MTEPRVEQPAVVATNTANDPRPASMLRRVDFDLGLDRAVGIDLAPPCPDCGPGYRIGDEGCRHGASPLIDSWPQWWCRACGNRYADLPSVIEDGCSCGGDLQPVTLQLVAREA